MRGPPEAPGNLGPSGYSLDNGQSGKTATTVFAPGFSLGHDRSACQVDNNRIERHDASQALRAMEADENSHAADSYFNEKSLAGVEQKYGNSFHYMESHGFKVYDSDDCRTAATLANAEVKDVEYGQAQANEAEAKKAK